VGVKALGFDQARALEAKAALCLCSGDALSRLFEKALLSSRLLASGRRRKYPDFAIGEDAVDVEENEFNFAGTSGGGWFGHRRNSSIREQCSHQLPFARRLPRKAGLRYRS